MGQVNWLAWKEISSLIGRDVAGRIIIALHRVLDHTPGDTNLNDTALSSTRPLYRIVTVRKLYCASVEIASEVSQD